MLHVPEILGHRQRAQRHAEPDAGRLVHLAEHQRRVREHTGLGHLEEQVVALAGALPHTCEHGHTTVLLRLSADHLLDDHRLADARTTEHADLAALHVGLEQVDDLDPGLEHDLLRLEVGERGRLAVDRPPIGGVDLGGVGIERLAQHVVDVAEHTLTDGHRDRLPGVGDGRSADEAVGRLQSDRADR